MLEAPFPVGTRPSVAEVSDWVEFEALARSAAFLRGDLKSAIAREDVEGAETMEADVWQELEKRALFFGSRWPLRLRGNRLMRSPRPVVPIALYRFWCLLGIGGIDQSDRSLFELTVADLIGAFTGTPGLHIGAPASAGQDPSFRRRVSSYIADAGIVESEVMKGVLPDDKDLGIDAVTWRRFEDGRGGNLHFVVQCATGDWGGKLHDIDLEVWKGHINWGVPPVRAFATPAVLSLPEAKWIRVSRQGGLLLDRPRLVELAAEVDLSREVLRAVGQRVRALAAA